MLISKTTLRLLIAIIGCCSVNLAAPVASWAACGGSSPNWTSTADQPSLCGCIKGATPGDTITVSGSATWTTGCEFTRGVRLVGVGKPTLTGKVRFFYWRASSDALSANDTFTLQGFTLDGDNSTSGELGSAGLIHISSSATKYIRTAILDNIIKNTGARGVYVAARVYGVIARNTFDHVYAPLGAYGNDQYSWHYETQAFGVEQNLYFENNLIQNYAPGQRAIGGGQGGRFVVRYNDYDYSGVTGNVWIFAVHGLQSMQAADGGVCGYEGQPFCDASRAVCEQYSNMVTEIYGNRIYNAPYIADTQQQRGGWGLFHHNSTSSTGGNGLITYKQYGCDSCQKWGSTYGPYVQHVSNTYVWSNFHNGARVGMTKGDDYCADATPDSPYKYTITEDRDYFSDKYATFNGTSGVGCGTLAARPATCTTGVGYWATNQSCTDVSGLVGRQPSTPISGTLYKCTATNTWTAYYTPYQYPHPLSGPAPPRKVAIK